LEKGSRKKRKGADGPLGDEEFFYLSPERRRMVRKEDFNRGEK